MVPPNLVDFPVSPIWPAAGAGLALLILGGTRWWPAVAAGAFLTNIGPSGFTLVASVLAAAGTTSGQVLAAAYLRRCGIRGRLQSYPDALRLILHGGLGSSMVSASVGTSALWLSGVVAAERFQLAFLTWLVGDAVGVLVVTPFFLALRPWPRWSVREWLELALLGVVAFVFAWHSLLDARRMPVFLEFPLLFWAALRFREAGAALTASLVSVAGVALTVSGQGIFHTGEVLESLLLLQRYVLVMAGSGIFLGVTAEMIASSQRRLEQALAAGEEARRREQEERERAERERALAEEARHSADEARREAESANRAKDDFLAVVSHELRTPLQGVIGFAQLLEQSAADSRQRSWAAQIAECGENLGRMISEILDFVDLDGPPAAPEAGAVDARGLVATVVRRHRRLAEEKGLQVETGFAGSLPPRIATDEARLEKILSHLVANAVSFTKSGKVLVRVEYEAAQGGMLVVAVRDTGTGIHPADQERMFEPFFQGDSSNTRLHGGLGLGLAMVCRLARQLGAQVGLQSEPGVGSCFTLRLPAPPVAIGAPGEVGRGSPGTAVPEGLRVLVAEDNAVNRRILQAMLEDFACRVTLVPDGSEALQALGDPRQTWDLLLLDLRMPGVDGWETVRRWRAFEQGRPELGRLPIVAITAHVFPADREKCLEAGIDEVMAKPFRRQDLHALLARCVPRQRP